MANIGDSGFYKRGDSYAIMPITGNDGGLAAGGFSDLGGLQGYMNSLNSDLAYYKKILPTVHGQVMSLQRPDGSNYGESHYTGPDPAAQIKMLESKIAEAEAGQGVFAPNYNNGAQVINGNYTEKAAIDAEAAHQAAVKAGKEKIAQTVNGVNFYQPIDAAPFQQGSVPGSNSGQNVASLIPTVGGKLASAGEPDAGTYQSTYTPAATAGLPTQALQPGMTGDAVKQLQDYLVANGYMTQAQVNTGYGTYGPQTTDAVKALQQKLQVDNSSGPGYFGPKTIAAAQGISASTGNPTNGTSSTTPQTNSGGLPNFQATGDASKDSLFNSLKDGIVNTLANGYAVNPNLDITPDLVSKFLAQAHTLVDPYHQKILSNEIGNINASLKSLGTNYQNQTGQTVQDYQTGLANTREEAAGNGTVFSGQRGLNEKNATDSTNRNLSNIDNQFATNIGNTLRTGASNVGNGIQGLQGSLNDFVTPQLNRSMVSLEGARGSTTSGGALDYGYNPSIYSTGAYNNGAIGDTYNKSLLDQQAKLNSNYLESAANTNPRTLQNLQ